MNYDDAIYDYLDNEEFYFKITNLGHYIENCPPMVKNYQLVLLCGANGFSYPMIMPWAQETDPSTLEVLKFIVQTENTFNEMAPTGIEDVPLHVAINCDAYRESGLDKFLGTMIGKLNLPMEAPCNPV